MKFKGRLLPIIVASTAVLFSGGVASARADSFLTNPLLRLGLTGSQLARVQAAQSHGKTVGLSMVDAVSCARHDSCEAIGIRYSFRQKSEYVVTSTMVSFAEHWNGTRWSAQRVINPTDESELRSISCYAPDRCVAVGAFEASDKLTGRALPLTEVWNGVRWRQVAIGAPKSKKISVALVGVSCLPSASCTAVGAYANTNGTRTRSYATQFNGGKWSRISAPNLPFGYDISCPAAGDCFATSMIGSRVAHEQDGRWTIQRVQLPKRPVTAFLTALSCGSADDCVAAGSYQEYLKARHLWIDEPFVEHFDGSSWHRMLLPKVVYTPFGDDYPSVSCSSFGHCLAVGFGLKHGYQTLELTDGTWRSAGVYKNLQDAISCPDFNYCVATNDTFTGLGEIKATAQSSIFDGTGWRTVKMPIPASLFGGV